LNLKRSEETGNWNDSRHDYDRINRMKESFKRSKLSNVHNADLLSRGTNFRNDFPGTVKNSMQDGADLVSIYREIN
jgi:hypothetical protein